MKTFFKQVWTSTKIKFFKGIKMNEYLTERYRSYSPLYAKFNWTDIMNELHLSRSEMLKVKPMILKHFELTSFAKLNKETFIAVCCFALEVL